MNHVRNCAPLDPGVAYVKPATPMIMHITTLVCIWKSNWYLQQMGILPRTRFWSSSICSEEMKSTVCSQPSKALVKQNTRELGTSVRHDPGRCLTPGLSAAWLLATACAAAPFVTAVAGRRRPRPRPLPQLCAGSRPRAGPQTPPPGNLAAFPIVEVVFGNCSLLRHRGHPSSPSFMATAI